MEAQARVSISFYISRRLWGVDDQKEYKQVPLIWMPDSRINCCFFSTKIKTISQEK
jgi:hypothetical protein